MALFDTLRLEQDRVKREISKVSAYINELEQKKLTDRYYLKGLQIAYELLQMPYMPSDKPFIYSKGG